jgi:hypothetical protein
MVELAQTHQIKVILCSVLPANYFYWKPKKNLDTILALNKVLKVMLRQMILSITTQLWLTIKRRTRLFKTGAPKQSWLSANGTNC